MEKLSDAVKSRRIAILSAEHASLQAQRGSTQSEVLVRQGLYLTLASAVLLSLGLVVQGTGFTRDFLVIAICALAVVALIGALTQVRQFNADAEDMMYVLAMNRIRGAYLELEPELAGEFLTSPHDDIAGAMQTYYFLARRRTTVLGAAATFISLVNGGILALLAGAIAGLSGAELWLAITIGVAAFALVFALCVLWVFAGYSSTQKRHVPARPSVPLPPEPRARTGSSA